MIHEKDQGEGHKIYEQLRDLDAKGALSPEEESVKDQLIKRSEQVYNQAYQDGGNGNWAGGGAKQ